MSDSNTLTRLLMLEEIEEEIILSQIMLESNTEVHLT